MMETIRRDAGLCVQILLAWTFILPSAWPQGGGPPVFSVRTAPAEKVKMAPTLAFTGSIEPWRVIDLPAQVSGQIDSIPIEEGQPLKTGDLVCRLDQEETSLLVDRHRALVQAASAELQRLSAGLLPEEIEEARKNVDAAEARFVRAREEWERFRPLVDQGVSTLNQGTQMEAAYHEAEAQLRSAEARLRLLQRGFREEAILKARAELEKEKADLAEIERQLKHHVILAPTECVIVERLTEPGEWVDKGEALARLAVLNPLRVRIDVPQMYLSRLKVGQTATLRVDGWDGKTYEAIVESIVPRSGASTRNFPVLMRLENPGQLLSGGLFARVDLRLDEEREMTAVPRQAVLVRGKDLVVLAADPVRANPATSADSGTLSPQSQGETAGPAPDALIRAITVRTGNDIGELVTIEPIEGPGIRPGEEVVVLGGTRLQTGMPVQIIRDEPTPQTLTPPENAEGPSSE